MTLLDIPGPLDSFTDFVTSHLRELWHALIFVGASSAVIVVLIGVIMVGIGVKYNKVSGRHLILSGIILAIVVEYFVLFPPDFVNG
jgi:hypothetical protein